MGAMMDSGIRREFKFRTAADALPARMESSGKRGGPLTLLIVEDHADSAAALAFLLRHEGYKVLLAATASQALELASEQAVDLVISDIGLPDGDGCALMAQLHDRYNLNGIAMTGSTTADDAVHMSTSGFVEKIAKPIEFQRLFSAIQLATGGSAN
jgi:DNA-binding NtrC family response regulator